MSDSVFCEFPATVDFLSQMELDSSHVLLQSQVSPNNFQQAFSFNFSTDSNSCMYYLKMSGSVTLWGNQNHFDGYCKFNSITNNMYGPGGLDGYLSPSADIAPAAYDSAHVYDFFYDGDGVSPSFSFIDFPYWDNYGTVNFDWYAIPCFDLEWDFGDGSVSSDLNPSHTYDSPGTYVVTLRVTDLYGNCDETVTKTIHVIQSPVVHASGLNSEFCESDDAVQLIGIPGGGLFSGPGLDGNSFDPTMVQTDQDLSIIYTYADSFGCGAAAEMSTIVHADPEVVLFGLDEEYCADQNAELLHAEPAGGQIEGDLTSWYFDPSTAELETPIDFHYFFIDEHGCSGSASISTLVHDVPRPDLGVDTALCFPGMYELSPGDFTHFSWHDFSQDSKLNITESGAFGVEVENEYGCTASDQITISDACSLPFYIPNAFTPDGDGINDVFKPVIFEDFVLSYRLQIYNRWGQLLFQTTDLNVHWDGGTGITYAEPGVYTWRVSIELRDYEGIKIVDEGGSVAVLR